MMKHAFLIIAHTCEDDLIHLIQSIDHESHDIYIHIDKKWKNCDFEKIKASAKHSSIVFSENRLSVIWGGVSLIRVELLLFELALQNGNYQYLHLLSGQDMCIKSPAEFHAFFDTCCGCEFLCFSSMDWQQAAQDRVKYYHMNCGRNPIKNKLNSLSVVIQKLLHVNRLKNSELVFRGGSEWASITCEFAKYLVSQKQQILKTFAHTFCCDEVYKHTYALNSEFKNNIYLFKILPKNDDPDPDMYRANMRLIDWVRGKPYTLTEDDFEMIQSSPCMFVRKVSSSNGLPDMILNACIKNHETAQPTT